MSCHGPTHDQARVHIQNDRKLHPALGNPHRGDIPEPFPTSSRGGEIAVQQIWSHRIIMVAILRTHATLFLHSPQASLVHQALHPVLAAADALCPQFGMDA